MSESGQQHTAGPAPSAGRLRWRCRRGMRELDTLLLGWLDRHYAITDDQTRHLFSELLDLQDPELMAMIHGSALTDNRKDPDKSSRDSRFDTIIEQIRHSVQA